MSPYEALKISDSANLKSVDHAERKQEIL